MEGIRLFGTKSLVKEVTEGLDELPKLPTDYTSELITKDNPIQECHSDRDSLLVAQHLKQSLEGLIRYLFRNDPGLKIRWTNAYFPFTSPSWEMEVFYNGKWLEILGCGIMQQEILNSHGTSDKMGWAFGLGLERIAMVLFDIPDIRLFWSTDPRFLDQFKEGQFTKFVPFSKFPVCYKDISFWCPVEFHENDFTEIVRTVAGDLVEKVELVLII